ASTIRGANLEGIQMRNGKNIEVDLLPPHSPQAEQGVLGCILADPTNCLPTVAEAIESESFYDLRHREIFDHCRRMMDNGIPIDLITLQARMSEAKMLDNVGGILYLNEIQDSITSPANLPYYLEIVAEKSLLRRVLSACIESADEIREWTGGVDELVDRIETRMIGFSLARNQKKTDAIKSVVHRAIDAIQYRFDHQGEVTGIKTGFPDLDNMTDGLHAGEMWVIAARPSMGKTSLAMNIVERVALEEKLPVGVFSLEMSSESLVTRMICSLSRANLRQINRGFLSESDFPKICTASTRIGNSRLFIDDTAGLSILQLRARARRMGQQHGIKLFVVDYLQLLNAAGKRSEENRQQEIADISGGLKAMAKELNVPVIVLAQLNREIEKDRKRKPRLSDLRESGAIEQDADLVGLLYKPESSEDEDQECEAAQVNLLIAKQRNGPTGDVNLTFLKPYTRFESAAK
ncbi:MAG: replicative DNA helicase, partial [Patescibacteria group bacterium]|nr:replicative DNA helicase [Patescibacteria group bacterium]